ncbi:ABC transporter ATP-binding protein [Williamsia deligens]|uniref:ABC transporter ATP-binding protein n=1 Tax=Williamsia deligens TaxID=321325 RepID=A0ABW3G9W6_9NOCA|nr:ABC transporter ATP-binding protein [Williamsia deligens]MCP2196102.1 iron complex transport system ATP-binding protein [Williamsia deligens]
MTGADVRYEDVAVSLGGAEILRSLRLDVGAGRFVGLIGRNGSGKSTVLRCLFRALHPDSGVVSLDGVDVTGISLRDNALRVAALTQSTSMFLDVTVREVIRTGRLPHTRLLRSLSAADEAACDRAVADAGVRHLLDRRFGELSGGEAQRVVIARALAQETPVLVLDEPTNHLDVAHQFAVLRAAQARGVTVLAALHDLNVAAQFCTDLAVVADGHIVTSGSPAEVLTVETVRRWFGIDCHVVSHPRLGVPQIIVDEGEK